jgi:predicted nucleic acid-binding protein
VLTEYLNYFAAWDLHFRHRAALKPLNNVLGVMGSISMQTMRDQGITDVLTNDAHFTQEGFRALLRGDQV